MAEQRTHAFSHQAGLPRQLAGVWMLLPADLLAQVHDNSVAVADLILQL